jgi:hypothetical protein
MFLRNSYLKLHVFMCYANFKTTVPLHIRAELLAKGEIEGEDGSVGTGAIDQHSAMAVGEAETGSEGDELPVVTLSTGGHIRLIVIVE